MTNITLDGLPAKSGTISDAGVLHLRESGVDKKVTVSAFLSKISAQYQTFMNTFLGTADKAAARAALDIARRTAVSNADYTILATDKVVAQIGTMSAARIFSLPTAALYPAGEELIIVDQSGTVTSSNKITVSRASADTIDGATSVDILFAYGFLKLISDGVSKWKISSSSIATTTVAGTVELATNAELAAGTDTTRAPTAAAIASLFGASSLSNDSYTRIPVKVSGAFAEEIRQYGNFTTTINAGSTGAIVFPLTFPNALRSIAITINGTGGANDALSAPIITLRSTSGFTVKNTDGDSTITSLYWQAVGN